MIRFLFRISILSFVLLLLNACGKVENSSSQDAVLYTDTTVEGGEAFQKIRTVLATKCFTCHSHTSWKAYSEAQFFSNNLASSGSLSGSMIYYRLIGAKSGAGPKDMPESGAAFTSDEITLMENWILGL